MSLRRWSSTLAFVATLAFAPGAWAQTASPGEDAFYNASNLLREGQHEEAAAAFLRLATELPNDPFADDALGELARLYEEKLGDPKRALEIYDQILTLHPASRAARRATERATELRQGMGPDGADAQTLAEFNEIFRQYSVIPLADSIAKMEKLLAESPDFPLAARATHWLASQHQRNRQWEKAYAGYQQVQERWPKSAWAARATEAEGDLHLLRGNLEGAERTFTRLEKTAPGAALAAWERYAVRAWRRRVDVFSWFAVILILCALVARLRQLSGTWAECGRILIKPPTEVLYLVPVLALFCVAGLTEHFLMAKAIFVLSGAAIIFVWLNGCTVALAKRSNRLTWPVAMLHSAAVGLAILASVYLAVTQDQFVDQLIETLRFGPSH